MKATLLDTLRGTTKFVTGYGSIAWAEGDLAHDCCRRLVSDDGDDETGSRFRFLVVGAEFEPGEPTFTMHQLNALYPDAVLEKHGVPLDPCPDPRILRRTPFQPSWRPADARELIPPAEAQKLLRLWEVTGVNFLDHCVSRLIAEVHASNGEPPTTLIGIAKDNAHYWLDCTLDDLREEWEAENKKQTPSARTIRKQRSPRPPTKKEVTP